MKHDEQLPESIGDNGEIAIQNPDEVETVNLIASGYQWDCPRCERLNNEIEALEKVKCQSCGSEYLTSEPEHARI